MKFNYICAIAGVLILLASFPMFQGLRPLVDINMILRNLCN